METLWNRIKNDLKKGRKQNCGKCVAFTHCKRQADRHIESE